MPCCVHRRTVAMRRHRRRTRGRWEAAAARQTPRVRRSPPPSARLLSVPMSVAGDSGDTYAPLHVSAGRGDDSIWYGCRVSILWHERRPPIHTNAKAVRRRRPRDDERGAPVSGPYLRPCAAARRLARARSGLRDRHDDPQAPRRGPTGDLHRAEPRLRGAGTRKARRTSPLRYPDQPSRRVRPRRAAAAAVRYGRLRQRARAHRGRRARAEAVPRRRRQYGRTGPDLRTGGSSAVRTARRRARPSPPVLEAEADPRVRCRRPRRCDDALLEPNWVARLDIQPLPDRQHRAHHRSGTPLRTLRGAVGASTRTSRGSADRTVAVRRRPRTAARRMTLPGSRLRQAALRVPSDPLLSVAMAVFNERATIEESIDGVLVVK